MQRNALIFDSFYSFPTRPTNIHTAIYYKIRMMCHTWKLLFNVRGTIEQGTNNNLFFLINNINIREKVNIYSHI